MNVFTNRLGLGELNGLCYVHKFGRNGDIDTGTAEDIWSQGGTYTFMTAATALKASSSNAADTVAIVVEGLDGNWEEQTATVTLTGQTAAAIPGTWLRVHRAYNAGATDLAGDVYIAEADTVTAGVPQTASKIKAKINIGTNQTHMAIYTIPAGCRALFASWYCSFDQDTATQNANVDYFIRPFGGVFRSKEPIKLINAGSSNYQRKYDVPQLITEKSDIKVRCTSVTANNTGLSAGFDLVLVK